MSPLKTAMSRHAPPGASAAPSTRPSETSEPINPVTAVGRVAWTPVGPPAAPSPHQLWWDRLPPAERSHTRACVEADDVDPQMLDILRCSGPVGPYGVRWARGGATFIPGSFVDFVTACAPIRAASPASPAPGAEPVT